MKPLQKKPMHVRMYASMCQQIRAEFYTALKTQPRADKEKNEVFSEILIQLADIGRYATDDRFIKEDNICDEPKRSEFVDRIVLFKNPLAGEIKQSAEAAQAVCLVRSWHTVFAAWIAAGLDMFKTAHPSCPDSIAAKIERLWAIQKG